MPNQKSTPHPATINPPMKRNLNPQADAFLTVGAAWNEAKAKRIARLESPSSPQRKTRYIELKDQHNV